MRLARWVKLGGSAAVNFGKASLQQLRLGTTRANDVLVTGSQKSTEYTGSAGVLLSLVERPVSSIPRVGFEYVLPVPHSPAIRVGYWHDPYFSSVISREDLFRDDLLTQDHVTGGFGISLSRYFEANLGLDISRDTRTIIASAIVRVPRK